MSRLLLNEFINPSSSQIPCWFMRQAGRYLPEYRALREKAGDFLTMCFTPNYATEITLQPLRRFPFDAAILFSDILVIPYALEQDLEFKEKQGPVLTPLQPHNKFSELNLDENHFTLKLSPVFQTIKQLKQTLTPDKTLIGFAGGPFTVAAYMIEGSGSKTFDRLKTCMYKDKDYFQRLISLLIERTILYCDYQIQAGADVIQLFESWANLLPEEEFQKYIIAAHVQIIEALKTKYPFVPIISFPRAAGFLYENFIQKVPMDGLGIDYLVPLDWAKSKIPKHILVQGNLDPHLLLAGGNQMIQQIQNICNTFKDRKYIFNLGHGIIKETPIEHVHQTLDLVKSYQR